MPKPVKSLSITVKNSLRRLCIHPRFERETKNVVMEIAYRLYWMEYISISVVSESLLLVKCILWIVFFAFLCTFLCAYMVMDSEEFLFYWVTKGANRVDCQEYACCLSAVVDSCAFYVNEVLKQLFIFQDLVFPDDSTVLDASSSHDDQKIVSYHWEQSRWAGTN